MIFDQKLLQKNLRGMTASTEVLKDFKTTLLQLFVKICGFALWTKIILGYLQLHTTGAFQMSKQTLS